MAFNSSRVALSASYWCLRDFLAEATAGRVRSGTGGKPVLPAAAGNNGRAASGTAGQAG